jgi:predicted nucleotidyltransferase
MQYGWAMVKHAESDIDLVVPDASGLLKAVEQLEKLQDLLLERQVKDSLWYPHVEVFG